MAWQHCLDSTTQQILQATTAEFAGKATEIEDMLPPLYAEQEKLRDQISVVEECMEDYIASMTEGLLHGFAYQRSIGDINTFRAEWQVGTSYSQLDFVQVTDGESPFGYEYYLCTLSNTGDVSVNKPGSGTGWMLYWMSIGTTPLTHPPYIVELGGSFNNKIYGAQLEDFRIYEIITPPPPPPPDPPLPPYEENKYFYHGGTWYTLNTDVDDQIETNHGDWGAANDVVTRPFLEDAFYGLKAKLESIQKSITYLQNTKNKYIEMVPLLGKFIK